MTTLSDPTGAATDLGPALRQRVVVNPAAGWHDRGMDEREIHDHINDLVRTEHELREKLGSGEITAAEEHERLARPRPPENLQGFTLPLPGTRR